MPIKKVDEVKDPGLRAAGQEWQEALDLSNLTTRELDNAAEMKSQGMSDSEIREQILQDRK